jgi:hypothetical protein
MGLKKCFKCGKEKPLYEFYKHKHMADGHLNKCKSCTKSEARARELELKKDPEWIEKERQRHRDKYERLNYKDKQKLWDKDKVWKKTYIYKNLSRKIKTEKGQELHHWNYSDDYLEDVFIMTRAEHRKAHKYLLLNIEKRIFISDEGEWLDTKEKHKEYLESKGINF